MQIQFSYNNTIRCQNWENDSATAKEFIEKIRAVAKNAFSDLCFYSLICAGHNLLTVQHPILLIDPCKIHVQGEPVWTVEEWGEKIARSQEGVQNLGAKKPIATPASGNSSFRRQFEMANEEKKGAIRTSLRERGISIHTSEGKIGPFIFYNEEALQNLARAANRTTEELLTIATTRQEKGSVEFDLINCLFGDLDGLSPEKERSYRHLTLEGQRIYRSFTGYEPTWFEHLMSFLRHLWHRLW